MKNFMMRGVILAALLSSLILPASADFSSTDSTNLSNIKSYVYDIKTAVTSGTLFTNVSSINTSLKNVSSYLASIWTKIQSIDNRLDTNNTYTNTANGYLKNVQDYIGTSTQYARNTLNKVLQLILDETSTIDTALGYNSSYSTRKVIPLLYSLETYIKQIDTDTSNIDTKLGNIDSDTGYIPSIYNRFLSYPYATAANQSTIISKLGGLDDLATEETLQTLATEETLSSFREYALEYLDGIMLSSSGILSEFALNLTRESYGSIDTMYGMMQRLVEVLASDTDKDIRDSQEDNISQVYEDFLNVRFDGEVMGRTSLGASDFGSLSSVGSTAKDVASLNGQASVDSFIDGFSESNGVGLGWFDFLTQQALDVRASSTSTYSLDDSDPYNMGDFLSHYDWVFGGAVE